MVPLHVQFTCRCYAVSELLAVCYVDARAQTHKGQFHGKVDMTLKFQVCHIATKLVIIFHPYAEVKGTKRIISIGQIFCKIEPKY